MTFLLVVLALILAGSAIVWHSLVEIPAKPPCFMVVKIFGVPFYNWILTAGWHVLWGFPYLMNYILIVKEKRDLDLPLELVAANNVSLPAQIFCAWNTTEEYAKEFVSIGEDHGVESALTDILRERAREWSRSLIEGPQNHEELLDSGFEGTDVLLKAIIGKSEEYPHPCPIDSDIPTSLLLKYFNKPQLPPTKSQAMRWGEHWEVIKNKIETELNREEQARLNEQVKNRRTFIHKVRQGQVMIPIPGFGIVLNRLNLGGIVPPKELQKVMAANAVEKHNIEAKETRLDFVDRRLKLLMAPPLNFTKEKALEIVQVETEIVPKTINELKWALSSETREMIEGLGQHIIERIFPGNERQSRKEPSNGR